MSRPISERLAHRLRGLRRTLGSRTTHRAETRSPAWSATQFLGLPLPLLALGLAIAAIIGLLLSYALLLTTGRSAVGDGPLDDGLDGNIPPGLPVLTEATLGPEVQSLIDAGYVDESADFDLHRCLEQQGIEEPVLILEEAVWGPTKTVSWLIVHTGDDAAQLQSAGGPVNVTVVRPTCGTASGADSRLWSGSTMLAPRAG